MVKMLLLAIFSLQAMFSVVSADEATTTNASTATSEKEIRERLQRFTDTVNKGDVTTLASFWTEDAELYRPATGEVLDGRQAIDEFLQKIAKEIQQRHLKFNFQPFQINFVDQDEAIVDGVVEVSDEKGALLQRAARRLDMVNDNGQWFIDTAREIEVAPAPPQFAYLKGVEWLLGNWKDEDDDVAITFNTDWDKFRNFIKQRFSMKVYGLEAMEGVQIIGWDPIDKKIRSWVFDSDGGFGSGVWSQVGDSWQVALNYTLSDGTPASATQIYKKLSDKSYSFASKDRKINGQAIPDVNPVTVVKEE